MKPSLAIKSLSLLLSVNQPAFLSGPPGIGKSSLIKQYSQQHNLDLIDLRAILLDPVDLRGLPIPVGDGDERTVRWITPEFLPQSGQGILFLDELNAAPRLVQSACLQLVLDRRIGEYQLPDGWQIVSAGNRETDGAGIGSMITPLADRFTHIEVEADLDDWCLWAFDNRVPAPLIAFLRFRPGLFSQTPSNNGEIVFNSPRSWAAVGEIMAQQPDKDIEFELYCGRVNEGTAQELIAFLEMYRSLPNIDAILINPQTSHVPGMDEPSALYAVVTALASKANPSNMDAIIQYADRLPKEFAVCLIKDALSRNQDVASTQAFIRWAAENKDTFA